jgi:hypothetical protein
MFRRATFKIEPRFGFDVILFAQAMTILFFKLAASALLQDEDHVLVLESGHNVTSASAIIGGKRFAFFASPFGGNNVSNALDAKLKARQIDLRPPILRSVKESSCFVSLDPNREPDNSMELSFEIGTISLNRERFLAPERNFSNRVPLSWNVLRVLFIGRRDRSCLLSLLPRDLFVMIVNLCCREGFVEVVENCLNQVCGLVWFGLVWFGLVWFGLVWFGLVWFGLVWFGLVWFGLVWFGLVWFGLVWFGLVWFGLVWFGLVWFGLVWFGLVWFGLI